MDHAVVWQVLGTIVGAAQVVLGIVGIVYGRKAEAR